jgi:hypothetical protein
MRPNRTAELANGEFGADGLQDSPKFALRGRCTDFGKANLRIFRDKHGRQKFYAKTAD